MNDIVNNSEHIPVLAETLSEWIKIPTDGIMVDATAGHGGHAEMFGKNMGPDAVVIAVDVDPESLNRAHDNLTGLDCRIILERENFANIKTVTKKHGFEKVDFILADLGFCSAQLENPERGLSFQKNMPLDMRLDDRLQTTAADILKSKDESEIADILYYYGQERASRRIAAYIVEERQHRPVDSTAHLAAIVCRALNKNPKARTDKIHPATKTFQALRIAVNDELGNLKKLLESGPHMLKKDGYFAIISFHSLEDRLVKESFKKYSKEGIFELLTKKPLVAAKNEIEQNPRSRSAKLRIARRK